MVISANAVPTTPILPPTSIDSSAYLQVRIDIFSRRQAEVGQRIRRAVDHPRGANGMFRTAIDDNRYPGHFGAIPS
jgi:hypothetical protein